MSWQLRVFNRASRACIKPLLRCQNDVGLARRSFVVTSRIFFRAPGFTTVLPDHAMPGHWIWSGPVQPRRVMLYLHGGGYILGSASTHKALVAQLSQLTGLRAFVPDYRLAPEHPFPAAFDDALAAWCRLTALGYRPRDIVLGGDSAGGGLALALLAELCQMGTPPGAVFGFSPWTDLTLTGASLVENAATDAFFPAERVAELRDMVTAGTDAGDARLSPLFASFPGCPPVLLQYSASEILRDDSVRMAERLRSFGAHVSEQGEADAPHVWHLFDRLLPEARASLQKVAEFTAQSLRASQAADN